MASVLERIGRARSAPLHTLTPDQARARYRAGAEVLDLPRAPLPRVESLTLPGGDGHARPARLYAARAMDDQEPLPALLYLHGGGFVVGDLETHDSLCRQIALRSGGAVVALDYRLAPEHPFPAAWDDAAAALRGLHEAARNLGLDASRMAIGGDSAGGTLAAATACHARDIGLELRLQVLITPGTSATGDTPSRRRYAKGHLIEDETIDWFFDHVIPRDQRHDPRFAPLEQSDLEGLCPAHVLLAECDPLVDEGLAYADRLRCAGVPVQLDLVRGVTHDFIKMGRALPEASEALNGIAQSLQGAWTS